MKTYLTLEGADENVQRFYSIQYTNADTYGTLTLVAGSSREAMDYVRYCYPDVEVDSFSIEIRSNS